MLLPCLGGCGRRPTMFPTQTEPAVTLVAVGDVMLDRAIDARIERHGVEWPFAEVRDVLRGADLAFCNLECPLSADGIKINKQIAFKADPANVGALTDAGFDIVSLANNHTLDCNRSGLIETIGCLDEAGIAHTGAGGTPADAARPTIVIVRGLRIAFLARNAWLSEGAWFRPDAPTSAYLDPETIESEVRSASRQADVVVVSLHWGVEYSTVPRESQVELAHRIIDAGADLILGHHPHVLQKVEKYHGGVIAYSLGNFLFDSAFRNCKETAILKCRLSKSGVSDVEQMPVRIEDYRPVPGRQGASGTITGFHASVLTRLFGPW